MTFCWLRQISSSSPKRGSTSTKAIFAIALIAMGALAVYLVRVAQEAERQRRQPIPATELPPRTVPLREAKRREPPPTPAPRPLPKIKMDLSRPEPELPPSPAQEISAAEMLSGPLILPFVPPPEGEPPEAAESPRVVRLVPVADTCILVTPGTEPERNGGALGELVARGNESFILARYDVSPIRGWIVRKAVWRAKLRRGRAVAVGISVVREGWEEGTHTLAEAPSRGATFRWANFTRRPWRENKAPFTHLIRGHAGGLFAVVTPTVTTNQWLEVAIPPILLQALVAGVGDSLAISDEKGQLGVGFAISSREVLDEEHYLEIEGYPHLSSPPPAVSNFRALAHPYLRRTNSVGILLEWTSPAGEEPPFCYEVRWARAPSQPDKATATERYLVPWPDKPGSRQAMVLSGLKPDAPHIFFIRAVSKTGTPGPWSEAAARTPPPLVLPSVPQFATFDARAIQLPEGALTLRVLSETDGLHPGTGRIFAGAGDVPPSLADRSHLWERDSRTVHLQAGQGETVGFQVVLSRTGTNWPSLVLRAAPFETSEGAVTGLSTRIYQMAASHVPTRTDPLAWLMDELIPVSGNRLELSQSATAARMADPGHQALYVEIAVPTHMSAGLYRGRISLGAAGSPAVELLLLLRVLPAALPLRPRFVAELGASPILAKQHLGRDPASRREAFEIEKMYHQLALEHRATLLVRPYSGQGAPVPWMVPPLVGSPTNLFIQSWLPWDAQFADLLSGRWPQEEIRRPSHVWLPLFEGWPLPWSSGWLRDSDVVTGPDHLPRFVGTQPASAWLSREYLREWRRIASAFDAHFVEKGWTGALGHVWFVNIPTNRYRGKPLPLALGQPSYRDDFLALELFARAFPENPTALVFRVTVPDAAALSLYGLHRFHLLAVSDRSAAAWNLLRARADVDGARLWLMNDSMPFNETPLPTFAGVLRAFFSGADGWVIRQCLADLETAGVGAPEALLRTGRTCGQSRPLATLRLKALRRLQQDIEWLLALQQAKDWTREQLADFAYSVAPHITDPWRITTEDVSRLRKAVQAALCP